MCDTLGTFALGNYEANNNTLDLVIMFWTVHSPLHIIQKNVLCVCRATLVVH